VKIQWEGKFVGGVKAKYYWAGPFQQTFENKKFVDITQQCLPYYLK
jgi:hypothetical protein